jgi:glycosyltransferase involved in cell wall biosynthesis
MKIVTANNYYYPRGGSERVLFDEERILRSMGHEIIPFSTRHEANFSSSPESYFVPARDLEGGSMLTKVGKVKAVLHNGATGRAFGRILDAQKPDLVHAHNIYGTLTTSVLVEAQRRGVPAILTTHDAKLVCPTYLCLDHGRICEACEGKHFYRAAVRRCHHQGALASLVFAAESYFNSWLKRYEILQCLITPSRFFQDLFIRNGIPSKRIVHIANGVDLELIKPEFSPGRYMLYAGRLSREKGVFTLIAALRGTKVPLRIVGDGPVRDTAQQLASGADNIQFQGHCVGEQLAVLFRGASCIIQPSEWYENAPMSLLEAYAYGKPVVASRIGGLPELVDVGSTGELFDPGNVEQLRELLVGLWSRQDQLAAYGRNARRLVEEKFSLKLHCDRLLDLYRQVTA